MSCTGWLGASEGGAGKDRRRRRPEWRKEGPRSVGSCTGERPSQLERCIPPACSAPNPRACRARTEVSRVDACSMLLLLPFQAVSNPCQKALHSEPGAVSWQRSGKVRSGMQRANRLGSSRGQGAPTRRPGTSQAASLALPCIRSIDAHIRELGELDHHTRHAHCALTPVR